MKMMKFLSAFAAVAVILIACSKEGLFNNHAELQGMSKHDSNYATKKDTCIRINGKDSCFKIYLPSDTVCHGGPYSDTTYYPGDSTYYPNDSTYYPGGGKDTCFKWPTPIDSSSKKR